MNPTKALLVIDMQKGSFTPETPRHDTPGVVNRINALATQFRASGNPVLFIQHDGSAMNEFIPKTTEWDLLDELVVESNDLLVDKYANDVFYQSNLQATLSQLGAKELFITGCATDFCVESTVQSALSKNFDITVIADGHTTGDRPHLKAEQVIAHYNWVWQNMIPTQGHLQVKAFEQVIHRAL